MQIFLGVVTQRSTLPTHFNHHLHVVFSLSLSLSLEQPRLVSHLQHSTIALHYTALQAVQDAPGVRGMQRDVQTQIWSGCAGLALTFFFWW